MDVSVIIVNYNTKELILNCIDSIFLHTHDVSFEVIVIDNASTDGSVEVLKKDKRIVFVASSDNLGFGKANNLGYQYATGKYVFLLNSDTLLLNNAIKCFYDWMEHKAASNVSCVGCLLLDFRGKPMHSFGYFPSLNKVVRSIMLNYLPFFSTPKDVGIVKKSNDGYPVDYITGADLFIRRTVIEKCGLFDPDYFMYYEETDMQYRYFSAGYHSELIFTPKIQHLQGASIQKEKSLKRLRLSMLGCFLYSKKNVPFYKYIIIRILYLLLIPKILIYPDIWQEKRLMLKSMMSV